MSCHIEMLKDLSNAKGISGFEDEVLDVVRQYCTEDIEVKESNIRNLYLRPKFNTGSRPVVMIDGHSDELGFMVQSITGNGLLKIVPIGGWVANNVLAHKVKVRNRHGKYFTGVFSTKPIHFMSEEEKKKRFDFNDLKVDIGAVSRDEVTDLFEIEVGAPIVPDVAFEYHELSKNLFGKAFDNRLGCGLVIETLKALGDYDLEVDVVGTITSQEEIGGRGAMVAVDEVNPDVAIIFEGTPSDDLYKDEFEIQGGLGMGPQIRHRDLSMISNPRFTRWAKDIAEELSLPYQDAVRVGGGTNGGIVHTRNMGIPSIVIGVPVRYVHAHHGIARVYDYEQAHRWALEIIKRLDQETIESF